MNIYVLLQMEFGSSISCWRVWLYWGIVRIYRGKAGIVEKIVLIGIVILVMMAPFRYSQASR